MKPRLAVLAASLLLVGGPVAAQVHLAYGPEYEDQFRAVCVESFAARDCQCGLERLQHSAGYGAFAEAMVRHGEAMLRVAEAAPARASLDACIGRIDGADAGSLVILATERRPAPSAELAAAQHLCGRREAAIAPRIKALVDRPDPRGIAELQSVLGNLASAREHCAAGDIDHEMATLDHIAAFLDANGFGDELAAP